MDVRKQKHFRGHKDDNSMDLTKEISSREIADQLGFEHFASAQQIDRVGSIRVNYQLGQFRSHATM